MSGKTYDAYGDLFKVDNPHAGGTYHVSWAKKGCVWNCSAVNEDGTVDLVTPKTRKRLRVKISELRHTRNTQDKINKLEMANKKHVLENYPNAVAVIVKTNSIEIQSPVFSGGYNVLGVGWNKRAAWQSASYAIKQDKTK